MSNQEELIRQEFIEGMSNISQFWGLPKGMGSLFGILYISQNPVSLDELVERSGLTKGAVSTNVRSLSRLGLVHRSTRLGDRKDYYEAETDFYKAIRAILSERQNSDFDRAVASVRTTLGKLETGQGEFDPAERQFMIERLHALQDFFNALDSLTRAISRLDGLGLNTVQNILKILK